MNFQESSLGKGISETAVLHPVVLSTMDVPPLGSLEALPEGIVRSENPVSDNHFIVTNPLDLHPPAVALWRTIMREYDVARAAGQKLVVLMGENHTMSTHIALQAHLARLVQAWHEEDEHNNRFIQCYELECDLFDNSYGSVDFNVRIKQGDGRLVLFAFNALRGYDEVPVSHAQLFATYAQLRQPVFLRI
jgi:hypothetical protein